MARFFLLALMLLLAACNGGDGDASLNAPIRYGTGVMPKTTNPHQAVEPVDQMLAENLFLGLVTIDGAGQIAPGIAKTWVVNPDGLTYVFRLRDSTWSDGTEITADTFVKSFQRLFDARKPSPLAADYLAIAQADAVLARKKRVTALGVKALAKDVLEIRLDQPQPAFLSLLAGPGAAPLPLHVLNKTKSGAWPLPGKLVTNGPYLIDSMGSVQVRLKKNQKFALAGFENRLPIHINLQSDADKRLSQFLGNEIDIMDARVVPNEVLAADSRLRQQLQREPEWTTTYLAANLADPQLKKSKLRTALAMLIDRQELVESLFPKTGYQANHGITPLLLTSHPAPTQAEFTALTMAQRQTDATRLLTELGINREQPLALQLITPATGKGKEVAAYLAARLELYGIRLSHQALPLAKFARAIAQRNYQLAMMMKTSTIDHPDIFLRALTCTQSRENITGYCNREVDNLLAAAMAQADPAARSSRFQQAERLILQDMPIIPLYVPVRQTLVSEKLYGWQNNPGGHHPLARLTRKRPDE